MRRLSVSVGCAHRLARAIEANDDDGKLVLPVNYSNENFTLRGGLRVEGASDLVRYSWRPLRRWYIADNELRTCPNGLLRASCVPHTVTLMGFFYLYYALGLPSFFSIVIALYLLFTGANQFPLVLKNNSQTATVSLTLPLLSQTPEKRSMLVGSSRSQVRTCGRRWVSVSV